MIGRSIIALAAVALTSCGSAEPNAQQSAGQEQSLSGYGALQFGMGLDDLLGVTSSYSFNSWGLRECFENIATEGCFLSPEENTSLFELRAGVPYSLTATLSKYDKLSRIALGWHREGEVSRDECSDIYLRSVDWVADEYGDLSAGPARHENPFRLVSPGGREVLASAGSNGFFVGLMDRNMGKQTSVGVMATYIVVDGNPNCRVDVTFEDDSLGTD